MKPPGNGLEHKHDTNGNTFITPESTSVMNNEELEKTIVCSNFTGPSHFVQMTVRFGSSHGFQSAI